MQTLQHNLKPCCQLPRRLFVLSATDRAAIAGTATPTRTRSARASSLVSGQTWRRDEDEDACVRPIVWSNRSAHSRCLRPLSQAMPAHGGTGTAMEAEVEMEDAAVPALAVVDARFCAADAASLAVAKALSMSGSDFAVTDAATGALVLRVDGVLFSLRRRCVLVDADRRPVLTVQESSLMLSTRWKVFRGDSTSRRDLLFTVVKPSVIQLRGPTKVSVFLASNDAEQACDFRITGSYHDGACAVSLGDSDTVIAKIDRRFSVVSALLGKNSYSVTVNPGIDYAFVVALVVILDEMHYQR